MAWPFRSRRLLVLERRERRARVAQLRQDMHTWAWWQFFLLDRVMPVVMFVAIVFLMGASWGVKLVGNAIADSMVCTEKVSDAH